MLFKKIAFITGIFTCALAQANSIHDVQGNFLQRDLGENDGYIPQATLTNYQNAIVTDVYSGETPQTLTFADWRSYNQYNATSAANRISGKYFNSADLGLGRNMNCWAQPTLEAQRGPGAMACYVSNHGKIGGSSETAFAALANSSSPEFATVAMEYWPNAPKNKVRFFVFASERDADGNGVNDGGGLVTGLNVVLDNGKGHEQPGLCMACHGGELSGTTSATTIDIQGAHFLPFDTFSFEFETPEQRASNQPAFNRMNKIIHKAEKQAYPTSASANNQQIWKFIEGSYNPGISSINASTGAGAAFIDTFTPPEFSTINEKNLYHTVAKPYCRGCHLASSRILTPALVTSATCNPDSGMPNAEVTAANLRRHMDFVANDIEKYTGSSSCYTMPHLIDFQHQNQSALLSWTNSVFNDVRGNIGAGIAPSGGKYISFDSSTSKTINTSDSIGIFNQRNTLKSTKLFTQNWNSFVINKTEVPGKAPAITSLAYLYFSTTGRASMWIPSSMDNTLLSSAHSVSLTAPPSPESNSLFLRESTVSVDAGAEKIHVYLPGFKGAANTDVPTSNEIDDIEVTFSGKIPGAIYQDFENVLLPTPVAFSTLSSFTGCSLSDSDRYGVSNQIKTRGDTGRYTLAATKLCRGDRVFLDINQSISTQGQGEISFEFAISKKIEGADMFIDMARNQGTLIEDATYRYGRVKYQTEDSSYIEFAASEDSGINGKPIQGFSIDNIRFVPKN